MNRRLLPLLALISLLWTGPLRAQGVLLLTTQQGQLLPVRAFDALTPEVLIDGQLKRITDPAKIVLRHVPTYGDGFIQANGFQVAEDLDSNGNAHDDLFSVTGQLEADHPLKNCFLLLVFETGDLSLVGIDDLDNRGFTPLTLHLPELRGRDLEHTNYVAHFFADGREIASSLMTPPDLAKAKKASDGAVLAAVANRGPVLVVMAKPKRPADLPAELSGKASVRCHIGTDGSVLDATLVDATNPEFGQAAVDAARQWFFAPMIKNHQYVEVTVRIPFIFRPAPPPPPKED